MTFAPMQRYCQHHDCQCETAAELMWMSDRLRRTELLARAVEVHQQNLIVRCRHQPRDHRTPFAARKDEHARQ